MIALLESLARPFLHALDPETAHRATILALRAAVLPPARRDDPALAIDAFGLKFPNPVGMAAGFGQKCRSRRCIVRARLRLRRDRHRDAETATR